MIENRYAQIVSVSSPPENCRLPQKPAPAIRRNCFDVKDRAKLRAVPGSSLATISSRVKQSTTDTECSDVRREPAPPAAKKREEG